MIEAAKAAGLKRLFGRLIAKSDDSWTKAKASFEKAYPGWQFYERKRLQRGKHPRSQAVFFGSKVCAYLDLIGAEPTSTKILDIGSDRAWLAGMLTAWEITSLDIRDRTPIGPRETLITGNAAAIPLPSSSFDLVSSWGTFYTVGLGRYDDFDTLADIKMLAEIARVLKSGGHFIVEIRTKPGQSAIHFNAFKCYSMERIHALAEQCKYSIIDEAVFLPDSGRSTSVVEFDNERDDLLGSYVALWRNG